MMKNEFFNRILFFSWLLQFLKLNYDLEKRPFDVACEKLWKRSFLTIFLLFLWVLRFLNLNNYLKKELFSCFLRFLKLNNDLKKGPSDVACEKWWKRGFPNHIFIVFMFFTISELNEFFNKIFILFVVFTLPEAK